MVNVPTYDIFPGTCYKDAQWLEAVVKAILAAVDTRKGRENKSAAS